MTEMDMGQKWGYGRRRETVRGALEAKRRKKQARWNHTFCAAQMYARVSRRAYTPFHAMPCHAKRARPATLRAHLASRDGLLSQDPRSDTPHPIVLTRFFIPSSTKLCREVAIAAGVEVARNVEGASVELVVVHLEGAEVAVVVVLYPENRAGMPSSLSCAILTHALSASLQRDNPLLSTLGLLTRPRTG